MRQERAVQASLFDRFAGHEIGRELKAMSQCLDEHPALIKLAAEDLRRHGVKETGRQGLPAESALRCGLLKQHRQLSYEELAFHLLAFHLEDSASFRAFARLPLSVDAEEVGAAQDGQRDPGRDLGSGQSARACQRARGEGRGRRSHPNGPHGRRRALMREPSDSRLLCDAVRVMARLLEEADALADAFFKIAGRDHRRAAKKRARAIKFTRVDRTEFRTTAN